MICYPNAKINLGLNIIKKRSDGFHNISSVIYPIQDLYDVLEIVESNSFSFTVSGTLFNNDIQSDKNICVKAYNLLKADFNLPCVKIHLHKRIKIGAGLGGGSSDGVFTLILLNDIFNLKLSKDDLKRYAIILGSDCPFFVENTPHIVSGKGELMKKIDINLKNYEFKFFFPDIFISTKEAYSNIEPKNPEVNLFDVISSPLQEWKEKLKNDFESYVFQKYPQLQKIKNEFYERGAVYSSMTGSGSVIYAIFKK
ncbi:MAG: 4-(cytidine 5'-diphospho)-2-C-methyl-D-erythritol kinase [Bacteroidota bacterium]|nr:4-(cytidine 5'-diphospho)-2-C-methyl-D-erythritol kinase [Bacteroidota bacterium]